MLTDDGWKKHNSGCLGKNGRAPLTRTVMGVPLSLDLSGLRKVVGLSKAPDVTTLCAAHRRLLKGLVTGPLMGHLPTFCPDQGSLTKTAPLAVTAATLAGQPLDSSRRGIAASQKTRGERAGKGLAGKNASR